MTKYEYITLKYRHDALTGEFVHVGLALFSEDRYLRAYFNSRFTRIKQLFGAIEKSNHKELTGYLQRRFNKISTEVGDQLPTMQKGLKEIAHSILPPDDSAYQWSKVQSGFTLNAEEEAKHLYERLVCRYENKRDKTRRGDEEIWSIFNKELREASLSVHLTEKELESSNYSFKFQKTYKNGRFHLLEALSFELEDISAITEKAVKWRGRASALQEAEAHEFWFLIGNVKDEKRKKEVIKAVNILSHIKAPTRFIYEENKEELVSKFKEVLGS